jgi:hypothetical protein
MIWNCDNVFGHQAVTTELSVLYSHAIFKLKIGILTLQKLKLYKLSYILDLSENGEGITG